MLEGANRGRDGEAALPRRLGGGADPLRRGLVGERPDTKARELAGGFVAGLEAFQGRNLCAGGGPLLSRRLGAAVGAELNAPRSAEHKSELQSLMSISYAVF